MTLFRSAVGGLALTGSALLVVAPAPALAAIDASQPGVFVETLTDEGLAALRGGNRAAARTKFRTLLSQHFAVDQIGEQLIRRWRNQITPAQLAAYKAAFPNFLIGTYADRLFDYANADVKVIRAVAAPGGGAAVQSQVIRPGGRPIAATWTLSRVGNAYKIRNLNVAGVNLALTQQADFDSVVQQRGFDGLVALLKSRG